MSSRVSKPSVRAMRLARCQGHGTGQNTACFKALGAGDEAREAGGPGGALAAQHVSKPSVRAMRLARLYTGDGHAHDKRFQSPRCGR